MHSNGFLHGDIKPDNFVVSGDWTVKLSDFGESHQGGTIAQKSLPRRPSVSKLLGKALVQPTEKKMRKRRSKTKDFDASCVTPLLLTDSEQDIDDDSINFGGTITWLSPERLYRTYKLFLDEDQRIMPIHGSPGLSKPADVYSFALVMWEIVTGAHPFPGANSFDTGLRVLVEDIRPSLERDPLDEEMKKLLRAAWARNAALRPSIRLIVHDLEEMLQREHAAAEKRVETVSAGGVVAKQTRPLQT